MYLCFLNYIRLIKIKCSQDGLGNTTAECVECNCNHIGSISDLCDPRTGLCPCKKGVTGVNCDTCSDGYHSFSSQGCIGKNKFITLNINK